MATWRQALEVVMTDEDVARLIVGSLLGLGRIMLGIKNVNRYPVIHTWSYKLAEVA